MFEIIREAGWPIYPVMAFGITALVLALRHATLPQRNLVPLIVGLCIATAIAGVLGTALGVQASANAIGRVAPGDRWIFLLGLKESLHNLTVALFLLLPTTIATMAGSYRLRCLLDEIETRSGS